MGVSHCCADAGKVVAMTEWQPMSTVPRDGTDVLVWGPYGHGYLVVGYEFDPLHPGYRWRASPDGPAYPEAAFTHWMQLPESPVSE